MQAQGDLKLAQRAYEVRKVKGHVDLCGVNLMPDTRHNVSKELYGVVRDRSQVYLKENR